MLCLVMEEWRDIPGFEGYYQASNLGRIRSVDRTVIRHGGYRAAGKPIRYKGKIISPHVNSSGYYLVTLYKRRKGTAKYVHILVATCFIENTENKREVNHIDGNKLNNSVENLEWVTSSENKLHAIRVLGTTKPKPPEPIRKPVLCSNGKVYKSQSEAARDLGNCRVTITGDFMCSSPSHIDFIEKTKCVRIKEAHAFVVRGTKYCKFESKEQQ